MAMRYKLPRGKDCQPVLGDGPPVAAARMMWLTVEEFKKKLPELLGRGFPPPDPTTGNFDMDAINEWRRARNKQLFIEFSPVGSAARDAKDVVRSRLAGVRDG